MVTLRTLLLTTLVLGSATGCSRSNDFMPTGDASGESIFNAACIECHEPEGNKVMVLSADMADVNAIANKVLTGSMAMPAFPNLQGEPGKRLAEYVLSNSKTK